MVTWLEFGEKDVGFRTLLCTLEQNVLEICAVFSLTKEAKKEGSKGLEWLPLFEELQSANILFLANDLWTEEDEWEGSLRDI